MKLLRRPVNMTKWRAFFAECGLENAHSDEVWRILFDLYSDRYEATGVDINLSAYQIADAYSEWSEDELKSEYELDEGLDVEKWLRERGAFIARTSTGKILFIHL